MSPPAALHAAEGKPSATHTQGTPDLAQLWQQVHDLAAESPATQFMVESVEATGIRLAGGTLMVCVTPTLGALGPPTPAQTTKIEALITRAAGCPAKIETKTSVAPPKSAAPTPAQSDASVRAQAVNHPLVKRAMELFDAKLVRVDKPQP